MGFPSSDPSITGLFKSTCDGLCTVAQSANTARCENFQPEFIDKLPEIQAPMEILHHNTTTINLKIKGNYGEGEVYVLAFHKVQTETGPFDLLIGGRYLDKYEKRDG